MLFAQPSNPASANMPRKANSPDHDDMMGSRCGSGGTGRTVSLLTRYRPPMVAGCLLASFIAAPMQTGTITQTGAERQTIKLGRA
jgi:hypothetical protein